MARLESTEAQFVEHGRSLKSERNSLTTIWRHLSDYWKLHGTKRNTIDSAWKTAQQMIGQLHSELDLIDGAWAFTKKSMVFQKASVVPVQLLFGTEEYFTNAGGTSTRSEFLDAIPDGSILCTPTSIDDQYVIPAWIRSILTLSDYISSPTLNMDSDDYFIASSVLDNKTGTICFNCVELTVDNVDDFAIGDSVSQAVSLATGTIIWLDSNTMVVGNVTGTFTYAGANAITNSGTGSCVASASVVRNSDYKDIMWSSYMVEKSLDEIITPFGSMVGYTCRKENRLETDAFYDVKALMYCLMTGPKVDNLETGISVFNIWPYAPFRCKVLEIGSSNAYITLQNLDDLYETITITNTTGLAFERRTESGWVSVNEQDEIPAYRAITQACRVETWTSAPDLLRSFGLTEFNGRHVFACIFDADLPLAGSVEGWLPSSSLSSITIPAVSGYAIDQARTWLHIDTARNSGTKPFFIVLLDADIDITEIKTTHGLWINTPDPSIYTSLSTMWIPNPSIDTTMGEWVSVPDPYITTVLGTLYYHRVADIDTDYAVPPNVPRSALGGTSYT